MDDKGQNQMLHNKWRVLDSVCNEIEMVQKLENSENSMKLTEINQKLHRLKELKSNVDKDESELKLEYLILMRERNVYFEKLKMIQTIGDSNGWHDDIGLLEAIKNLLSNLSTDQKDEGNKQ